MNILSSPLELRPLTPQHCGVHLLYLPLLLQNGVLHNFENEELKNPEIKRDFSMEKSARGVSPAQKKNKGGGGGRGRAGSKSKGGGDGGRRHSKSEGRDGSGESKEGSTGDAAPLVQLTKMSSDDMQQRRFF